LCLPTDDNDAGRETYRKSEEFFKLISYHKMGNARGREKREWQR